ncbi:recombination-associated protein RdgC [Mixta calida]|uniref:recombination-associated protein RdgC n=1 Tax=Mixta calida TaxID=665913 RepID=UPI002909B5DF|nr:recombination-associated protein RdgC [Mixta calida]MDU4291124.1 recombination-associated protein RdgC [Mixta calida]
MKNYRVIFPYSTTSIIPDDLLSRLENNAFHPLKDGQFRTSGFALLNESERVIFSDNRHLFYFCEQSRKADIKTVRHIYNERYQKIIDEGREVSEETAEAMKAAASSEALKYAPIKQSGVYILFDAPAGRLWCAGSTVKKCEEALKKLRTVLGSLDTEPLIFSTLAKRLARHIEGTGIRLHEQLYIPACGKVVAGDDTGFPVATFNGVDIRTRDVGNVLAGLYVISAEMQLQNGRREALASFTLAASPGGAVSLKGLEFAGGGDDSTDDARHASDMQIVAKTCGQIFTLLADFLNAKDA